MEAPKLRVVVWGENVHEQEMPEVRRIYPKGMHGTIAEALARGSDLEVSTAVLQDPEHGLADSRLADTDVLVWWGHARHAQVQDAVADRVVRRVNEGMGLIVLHSACQSKPFLRLMGTSGAVVWREANEEERIWVVNPGHPIAAGVGPMISLPEEEMYGEPFGIPEPQETVFLSWFAGGEVFRSGCTWRRGLGKIFYFRPGHETHPTYHDAAIQRVIANAVRWARPDGRHVWGSENRKVPLRGV